MKKQITMFLSLVVMILGILNTVVVNAATINWNQAKFNAISGMSHATSVYEEDADSILFMGSIVIDDISSDKYMVLGLRDTDYKNVYYYVISDSAFDVDYTWSGYVNGLYYKSWSSILSSYGDYDSETGILMTSDKKSIESSTYNGLYYASLGTRGIHLFSSSAFEYMDCAGSGYVFNYNSADLDNYSSSKKTEDKRAYYLIDNILGNYGDDISKAPNVSVDEYEPELPDITDSNSTYEKEIGVIRYKKTDFVYDNDLTHADDIMSEASGEILYKVSWEQYSSKGFDLMQDGVYVAFYDEVNATYWSNPLCIGDGKTYKSGNKRFVIGIRNFKKWTR